MEALKEALQILSQLNLDTTTDPETLGLAGAIYKRLWEELNEMEYLDKSITHIMKRVFI